jgi:hypothetical protein
VLTRVAKALAAVGEYSLAHAVAVRAERAAKAVDDPTDRGRALLDVAGSYAAAGLADSVAAVARQLADTAPLAPYRRQRARWASGDAQVR